MRSQVRDSIGKALDAAKSVGGIDGQTIAGLARHAFVGSMRIVYWIAAGVVASAALLTYKFLPARPPALLDEESAMVDTISLSEA